MRDNDDDDDLDGPVGQGGVHERGEVERAGALGGNVLGLEVESEGESDLELRAGQVTRLSELIGGQLLSWLEVWRRERLAVRVLGPVDLAAAMARSTMDDASSRRATSAGALTSRDPFSGALASTTV